jgi:hypothetical protein
MNALTLNSGATPKLFDFQSARATIGLHAPNASVNKIYIQTLEQV